MENSAKTAEEYLRDHPFVKSCLKMDLINYSSLARVISEESGKKNSTSFDALVIALRRIKEKLSQETVNDKRMKLLLEKASLEIKSKIEIFVLEKSINLDKIEELQKIIRRESGAFYLLEGSNNYTLITNEKYSQVTIKKFAHKIIRHDSDMVLVNIKTSSEILSIHGVIAYLTTLFAENEVNILEFMSCWTDTLFIINSKDLTKTIEFLEQTNKV